VISVVLPAHRPARSPGSGRTGQDERASRPGKWLRERADDGLNTSRARPRRVSWAAPVGAGEDIGQGSRAEHAEARHRLAVQLHTVEPLSHLSLFFLGRMAYKNPPMAISLVSCALPSVAVRCYRRPAAPSLRKAVLAHPAGRAAGVCSLPESPKLVATTSGLRVSFARCGALADLGYCPARASSSPAERAAAIS
jgi:hypothetical protein